MKGGLREKGTGMALPERLRALIGMDKSCPSVGRPYQLQLHLTDICNLRCVFCPTRTFVQRKNLDKSTELSSEQWRDLIRQAVALGIEEFHICGGGEPFFFQDRAITVMRRIKDFGKVGEVITNGTMLPGKTVSQLVEMGWDKITFSIDGPDAETHDTVRGGSSFERIVENIQEVTRQKRLAGKEKPQLCAHFVVCTLNYRRISEMIPLCASLGIDTFLIQALNVWSEDTLLYKLSAGQEEELQDILENTLAGTERAGLATNIQDFLRHDLFSKANAMDRAMRDASWEGSFIGSPCFMPWYNVSVFADGRTLPCFILRDRGLSVKEYTLAEIWESPYFNGLRKQMLTRKMGKDCAKCNPWSLAKTAEIRSGLQSSGG